MFFSSLIILAAAVFLIVNISASLLLSTVGFSSTCKLLLLQWAIPVKKGGDWGYTFLNHPPPPSLEFLSLLLYPWKFQTKQGITPRNSTKLLQRSEILRPETKIFGNSTWIFLDFNLNPENPLSISSVPLEIRYPYPPPLKEKQFSNDSLFEDTMRIWRYGH